MRRKYYFLVVACSLLLSQKSFADRSMEYSEKVDQLKALEQYQTDNDLSTRQKANRKLSQCDVSLNAECKALHVEQAKKMRLEETYKKSDLFSVTIYFEKDKVFPIKYVERDEFEDIADADLEMQTKEAIFQHYLGDGNLAFYPELHVSLDELVAIKVFVYKSDQLLDLIRDDRIIRIDHIGNHSELEEVLL